MNTFIGFKVAALAASVALGLGSTVAMAAVAPPLADQLPGQGKLLSTGTAPGVTIGVGTSTMDIVLNSNTVIDWGMGIAFNKTGAAGFNIGADATVNFSGAYGALNIDSTGNASQIFGALNNNAAANVWVANSNGIIVGSTAQISTTGATVALLANSIKTIYAPTTFDGLAVSDYQGTGGDVTVQKGAKAGGSLFVSGGRVVNVDMSGITATTVVTAGLHGGGNPLAVDNDSALAIVTGGVAGSALNRLASAGIATTNGKLAVATNDVAGVLTNNGDLTLPVVNGEVHNQGKLTSAANAQFTSLLNDGDYATTGAVGAIELIGGDFVNNGTTSLRGVYVLNGSFVNNGAFTTANGYIDVASDSAAPSFTKGADYSITNTGTITSPTGISIGANSDGWFDHNGPANDSTGSVINTGTIQVGAASGLFFYAHDDVSLGGQLQAKVGSTYKEVSATNPLSNFQIWAGDYTGAALNTDGVATVSTPVAVNGGTFIIGNQVKLMSDISGVNVAGDPAGFVQITAGKQSITDYAVRVASGKTVSAGQVFVNGDVVGNNPNVILQGTLSANQIVFGNVGLSISDLLSGPAGGLETTGANPYVYVGFSGAVKTAKYNNSNNFRFNYLPINNVGDDSLALVLDPVKFATNGTSNGLSAVNVLVNGDVDLFEGGTLGAVTPISGPGSAVTGVSTVPNTHLVVQSTGDITTGGDYYWPGYVYLGTINVDADGNALPGTLGFGEISLNGDFSNVLPGDIAGASGIHFITQFPLNITGLVTTNANAWVNFGTDALTAKYAGEQKAITGPFFGGTQGPGSVINYGVLSAANFHTAAPSDVR